jgi:hypothetical protein
MIDYGWIILDRKTGAYDGMYRDKEMAQNALDSLTKRIPQADWELKQNIGNLELPEFDFWINIYEEKTWQK